MTANTHTLAAAIDALAEQAHRCVDAPPLHSCHHYRLALAERIRDAIDHSATFRELAAASGCARRLGGGTALLATQEGIPGEIEGGARLIYETERGRKAVRRGVEACLRHAAELMRPHNFVPGGGPPLATDRHGAEVHFCDAAARQWNVAGFVARAAFFTGSVVYREALAELDTAIGEHGAPEDSRSAARLVLIAAEPDAPPPEPAGGVRSGLAQLQLLAA